MKNKFSSFMIAICLIIPFMFMLAACDHQHTYSEEWAINATHHWHAATCEHSEEKIDYAEHAYTDDGDTTCNTCAYVREVVAQPTNADLSVAYKNVAIKIWESIGIDNPLAQTVAMSESVPDKKVETVNNSELANIKANANSMAGILYMISLLYENSNFILTNGVAIFDASCSVGSQTFSYTFTLKPTIDLEANTLVLEFYNVIKGVPMQQYSNVEINYNFNTNELNSYRFYSQVGTQCVDMALTSDGKNMYYSTTTITDEFAIAVESKKNELLAAAESVDKLTTRFDREMQSYFDVLNQVLEEL